MSINPKSLSNEELLRAAELHEKSSEAFGQAARTSQVVLFMWQGRPDLQTIGDLIAAAKTDSKLQDVLDTNHRALVALNDIETDMIKAGWRTEAERSVVIMDDGAMMLRRPGH